MATATTHQKTGIALSYLEDCPRQHGFDRCLRSRAHEPLRSFVRLVKPPGWPVFDVLHGRIMA